jgi:hypothetical protein
MKKIIIAILIVVAILVGYYLLTLNGSLKPSLVEQSAIPVLEKASVSSLNFSYRQSPDGYVLLPSQSLPSEGLIENVTVISERELADFESREFASEYPPAIYISAFSNEARLTPLDWVEANKPFSNIELKLGDLTPTSISGVEGITYTVDGLYLIDMYVIAYNDEIYVLSGSYFETSDQTYQDFRELISSAVFTN